MVVVRAEMWPRGDHLHKRVLALGTLACLGAARYDAPGMGVRKGERAYRVRLFKDTSFGGPDGSAPEQIHLPRSRDIWREGLVRGHLPGRRGGWDLLGGALNALLGNRLADYVVARDLPMAILATTAFSEDDVRSSGPFASMASLEALARIAEGMRQAGLPERFVLCAHAVASGSEGVADMLHLWDEAPSERDAIVVEIQKALDDRRLSWT